MEAEPVYPVRERCLIVNLAGRSEATVRIGMFLLESFCSAVVTGANLEILGQALVIRNFGSFSAEDDRTVKQMKQTWKSLWEYSHQERNRNVPYYKSPRTVVGERIRMNFCLARPMRPLR